MDLDTTPFVAQIQSISSSISVGGGSQIFRNFSRIFTAIKKHKINDNVNLNLKIIKPPEILLIYPPDLQ